MPLYQLRTKTDTGILERLLLYRGIGEKEKTAFLQPSYDDHCHDPFLLKNMKKAAERLIQAIRAQEKIIIYTDYDHDGIPAAVIFYDFFKKIEYTNVDFYIPHRHREGFGLNPEAVDDFAKRGAKLLITADCGIADVDEVAQAQKLGIDVIVTDHHEVPPQPPKAFAIINPKQKGCKYPEKMLCGSGVAYKFILGVLGTERFGIPPGWEKWMLDMVGIATLSDMVPLVGENRVFAHYGLMVLRKTRRVGLQKLFSVLRIKQSELTEDDIGFSITPRINAASRMGTPEDAFFLLRSTEEVEAAGLAKHLEKLNTERKTLGATLTREINKAIEERFTTTPPALVLGNPEWRPALLGLAANSCVERLGVPVFLWGREEGGLIKGSCRAPEGFDVVEILRSLPEGVLTQLGGHTAAGGFAVAQDEIHRFPELIVEAVSQLKRKKPAPVWIDGRLTPEEVTSALYNEIRKLAPFGEGNRQPLFLVEGLVELVKPFGKSGGHIEIHIRGSQKTIKAIRFFADRDEHMKNIATGQQIQAIVTIERSTFGWKPELRLRLVDVLRPGSLVSAS